MCDLLERGTGVFLPGSHHETGTGLVKVVMILVTFQVGIIATNEHKEPNAHAALDHVQISTAILGKAA